MKLTAGSIGLVSAVCASLLSLALDTAAHASVRSEEKEVVGTVRVAYGDLDLAKEADAEILLGRIEKAAYRACGGNPRHYWTYNAMPRRTTEVFEECRADAIARTIDAIDAPALSQARAALLVGKADDAKAGG